MYFRPFPKPTNVSKCVTHTKSCPMFPLGSMMTQLEVQKLTGCFLGRLPNEWSKTPRTNWILVNSSKHE